MDEHRLEFGRGDFLVRNLLGVDKENGALAVGEHVEVGQTVQFQVRDAAAADEDLRLLLEPVRGRGGAAVHVQRSRDPVLRQLPTTTPRSSRSSSIGSRSPVRSARARSGPIGGRNFLHGFTASVAVFGSGTVAARPDDVGCPR